MARILLVEDDAALAGDILALLRATGHAADCAVSGGTALHIAEVAPFGLLIQEFGLTRHVDRVRGLDLGADNFLPNFTASTPGRECVG